MEILNIDELVTPAVKKVTIKGVEYEVKEISVQMFIENSKRAKEIDDNPNASQAERIAHIVKMINSFMPDCSEEILYSLDFSQLFKLLNFVQGKLEEETNKAPVIEEDKKGEPKKAKKPTR